LFAKHFTRRVRLIYYYKTYISLFLKQCYATLRPLCCLSFFDLRILITSLVSSNSSYTTTENMFAKNFRRRVTIIHSYKTHFSSFLRILLNDRKNIDIEICTQINNRQLLFIEYSDTCYQRSKQFCWPQHEYPSYMQLYIN